MSRPVDEADVLFGPGNGNDVPVAEAELICSLAGSVLSLSEKVKIRDQFRTADNDGKWAMLEKFCGPMKGGPEFITETRRELGL
jgi:hypothetical protein